MSIRFSISEDISNMDTTLQFLPEELKQFSSSIQEIYFETKIFPIEGEIIKFKLNGVLYRVKFESNSKVYNRINDDIELVICYVIHVWTLKYINN